MVGPTSNSSNFPSYIAQPLRVEPVHQSTLDHPAGSLGCRTHCRPLITQRFDEFIEQENLNPAPGQIRLRLTPEQPSFRPPGLTAPLPTHKPSPSLPKLGDVSPTTPPSKPQPLAEKRIYENRIATGEIIDIFA